MCLHHERGVLTLHKRDGNIRYFEYENDKFEFLNEYKSSEPQRGIAFVPRRGINVRKTPHCCFHDPTKH